MFVASRSARAAVALAAALLGGATAAWADAYDFTLDGGLVTASGSFDVTGPAGMYSSIDAVTGTYSVGTQAYGIDAVAGSGVGDRTIDATFSGRSTSSGASTFVPSFHLSGPLTYADGRYSGFVDYAAAVPGGADTGGALFSATVSAGSSGGAPAPALGTALATLLAGAVAVGSSRRRAAARLPGA